MDLGTTVARTAQGQHGLVLRRQLTAAGVHPDAVDAAVRTGRLERVARGVYAVPGSPRTREQELTCAVLRCGPDALAVGEPVLALLGVHTAELDAEVTVLLRPGRVVTNVPWRRRTDLWRERTLVASVADIPSVTLGRNVVEAAVDAGPDALERLVDGVRWLGARRLAAVTEQLDRLPGHPGVAALRASGLLLEDAAESPRERRVAALLAHHRPRRQVWITASIRVDLLVEPARLVVEYDGAAVHGSPSDGPATAARDDAIRNAGYVPVHVTKADLADETAFVARIDGLVDVLTTR